jgi:hypothetical protein
MYEIDMFPSRFFLIDDAINHKELMKVLNTIKKDTENLVKVASEPSGQTYKTNFFQREVHGELFIPLIEQINKLLAKDNISLELNSVPWYAEYGETDYHEPHTHSSHCILNNHQEKGGENYFRYSGIICLSNFGKTSFVNPNSSSFYNSTLLIKSEYNRVILFPSNLYHYVMPHGLRDKVRAIFSFNGILKMIIHNGNIN